MKKSKLSLIILLIVSICMTLLSGFTVEAALGTVGYVFTDSQNVKRRGANDVLRGVNFDYGFTSIDLTHAPPASNSLILDIRIDSPVGQSIIDLYTPKIESGFVSYSKRTDRIQITADISGVHDVYFCVNSGETFFYNANFYYFDGSSTLYKTYGETNQYKDTLEFSSPDKVNFLANLGILDNNLEKLDPMLPVTRIEMLKAVSGFYDLSQLPEVPVGIFMDVENEKDREIAYFLYQKGVIVLNNTGYLEPNVYVTPYEAAEYLTNMLGYSGDMIVIGKLAKAGKSSPDGHLRRNQMIDILYKALFMGYRVGYKTTSGAIWYEEYDDCFLNYTKGYEMGEGLVLATSYTSLYSAADNTGDYQVRINQNNYDIGKTSADEFLGVYCYYIYDTDKSGNETIKAIAPKFEDSIIKLDHTLDYTKISSKQIVYEDEKGRAEKIALTPSSCIIYNGKALDVELSSVIKNPQDFRGTMTVIDNNKDEKCDTLIITNAKSIVIGSISEKYVTSYTNSSDKFIFEENARAEFVRYGRIANAVDFAQKECVDVYESANKAGEKLYRIIAATDSIEASLISVSNDELKFDNSDIYELSPYAGYKPKVGDFGKFYLNGFGEILYFTSASTDDLSIGWLYKIFLNDDEEVAFLTFKTTDNRIKKYEIAKQSYIDGVRVKNYEGLKTGNNGATTVLNSKAGIDLDEPILYKLNSDEKISVIDTTKQIGKEKTSYDCLTVLLGDGVENFTCEGNAFYRQHALNSQQYHNVLDGTLAVMDSNTLVYNQSPLGQELNEFNTNKSFSDAGRPYICYTTGKGNTITADIVKVTTSSASNGTEPFVITNKSLFMDKNGEITYKFEGTTNKGKVEYIASNMIADKDPLYKAKLEILKPGDFISGDLTTGNTLKDIRIIHFGDNDFKDTAKNLRTAPDGTKVLPLFYSDLNLVPTDYGYESSYTYYKGEVGRLFNWEQKITIGTVIGVYDDYFVLERPNTKQTEKILLSSSANVVTIGDRGLDNDTAGSVSSLREGQMIIAYCNHYLPTAFFVFDNFN